MNMADLLKQNTKLIHELNTAVEMNERALITQAAFRLNLHNNVMVSELHGSEVLPPVEEPEELQKQGFAWEQDGSAVSTNPAVQTKPVD